MKESRRKSGPSSTRNMLSYIFSFILAVTLTVIAVVITAGHFLSANYLKKMINSDYVSDLMKEVKNEAVDYTLPTGIDTSVLDDVFTEDRIMEDVKTYIGNSFTSNKYEITTEELAKKLTENTMAYIKSQNISGEGVDAAVGDYVTAICNIYKKRIKLIGMDYIARVGNMFKRYFAIVLIALVVFAAANIFLCIKLHTHIHRGLRYVAYAFGAAGIMTFAAPMGAIINGFYKRLRITPLYFNHLISEYIGNAMKFMILLSIIWFIIMIADIIYISTLRRRVVRKHKTHKKSK